MCFDLVALGGTIAKMKTLRYFEANFAAHIRSVQLQIWKFQQKVLKANNVFKEEIFTVRPQIIYSIFAVHKTELYFRTISEG